MLDYSESGAGQLLAVLKKIALKVIEQDPKREFGGLTAKTILRITETLEGIFVIILKDEMPELKLLRTLLKDLDSYSEQLKQLPDSFKELISSADGIGTDLLTEDEYEGLLRILMTDTDPKQVFGFFEPSDPVEIIDLVNNLPPLAAAIIPKKVKQLVPNQIKMPNIHRYRYTITFTQGDSKDYNLVSIYNDLKKLIIESWLAPIIESMLAPITQAHSTACDFFTAPEEKGENPGPDSPDEAVCPYFEATNKVLKELSALKKIAPKCGDAIKLQEDELAELKNKFINSHLLPYLEGALNPQDLSSVKSLIQVFKKINSPAEPLLDDFEKTLSDRLTEHYLSLDLDTLKPDEFIECLNRLQELRFALNEVGFDHPDIMPKLNEQIKNGTDKLSQACNVIFLDTNITEETNRLEKCEKMLIDLKKLQAQKDLLETTLNLLPFEEKENENLQDRLEKVEALLEKNFFIESKNGKKPDLDLIEKNIDYFKFSADDADDKEKEVFDKYKKAENKIKIFTGKKESDERHELRCKLNAIILNKLGTLGEQINKAHKLETEISELQNKIDSNKNADSLTEQVEVSKARLDRFEATKELLKKFDNLQNPDCVSLASLITALDPVQVEAENAGDQELMGFINALKAKIKTKINIKFRELYNEICAPYQKILAEAKENSSLPQLESNIQTISEVLSKLDDLKDKVPEEISSDFKEKWQQIKDFKGLLEDLLERAQIKEERKAAINKAIEENIIEILVGEKVRLEESYMKKDGTIRNKTAEAGRIKALNETITGLREIKDDILKESQDLQNPENVRLAMENAINDNLEKFDKRKDLTGWFKKLSRMLLNALSIILVIPYFLKKKYSPSPSLTGFYSLKGRTYHEAEKTRDIIRSKCWDEVFTNAEIKVDSAKLCG